MQVSITNDRTGHHVPTDSPLRHLILLVQASVVWGVLGVAGTVGFLEYSAQPGFCNKRSITSERRLPGGSARKRSTCAELGTSPVVSRQTRRNLQPDCMNIFLGDGGIAGHFFRQNDKQIGKQSKRQGLSCRNWRR